jgi:hypothetical protein
VASLRRLRPSRGAARKLAWRSLMPAYLVVWALSPLAVHGLRTDLTIFFWPAAQVAAHGHPLDVYSTQVVNGYPDANGPLSLMVLAPLAAITNALGWTDPGVVAGIVGIVAGVLALLISREALRVIENARGQIPWRLAAQATFLVAPALWIAVTGFGHLEQIIEVYLVLLAVRRLLERRFVATGVLFGTALLARTAALTLCVPLLIAAGSVRRKAAVTLVAASVFTVGIGMLPFVLADGRGVLHSLVTYRGDLPIAGGSVWVLLYQSDSAAIIQHADAYLTLAVSGGLCLMLARARPNLARTPDGLMGLFCIATACFPMLAKTVHSYYLFEPCVFAMAWWLARPGAALNRRLAVPLLLTVATFLGEASASLPLTGLGAMEGLTSTLVVASSVTLVAVDLLRGTPTARPGHITEPAVAAPQGLR